jgi:hypothetical protein
MVTAATRVAIHAIKALTLLTMSPKRVRGTRGERRETGRRIRGKVVLVDQVIRIK